MKKKLLIIILTILVILIAGVYILFIPQHKSTLSEKEAIAAFLIQYPQLSEYQTTDLPPSSIESKQVSDGWYLGFIRRGSGMPGILDAKCYYLNNNNKNVTSKGEYKQENSIVVDIINIETCEPIVEIPKPQPAPVLSDKNTSIRLGELGIFNTISIRPLSIEEDSRCPIDVMCIQAGTVRLKIQVVSNTGTSISIVKLGQEFTTEGVKITLTNVIPENNSKINVLEKDYRFNFSVVKQDIPIVTDPKGKCFIGGCSSQLCTDMQYAVSTCEYTEKYACYKTAICERQVSGECNWTLTSKLNTCLLNYK